MKKKSKNTLQQVKVTEHESEAQGDTGDPGDTGIFRTIVEQSHDAVIIHTDLLIVYAAGMSLDHFGYNDPSLMIGRSILEFMDPYLQKQVKNKLLESERTGESIGLVEIELRSPEGLRVPVEIVSMPIQYKGRKSHLALVRDISSRKKAEQKIKESEEKFSRVFMLSPDVVAINSIDDGCLLDVNESFLRILGYSRDEVIGKTGNDINLWVYEEERNRIYQNLKESGFIKNLEIHFRSKDGHIYIGLTSGVIIDLGGRKCLLAITHNITEYEQLMKKFQESEEKFTRAFRLSPDSLVITRASDGKIIDANEGFGRIMGYSRDEIMGNSTISLNIWVDKEDRDCAIGMLKEKGEFSGLEAKFRRKDGSILHGMMSARIIDIDGEPCMLSFTRDITANKILEEQIRESEEKFSRIFRLSPDSITITRMRDGVYLDFNEAFTRLLGYTRDEAIGKSAMDLNIWVNKDDRDRAVSEIGEKGVILDQEFLFRTKAGGVLVGNLSGRTLEIQGETCVLFVTRNVTDRLKAEQELRESEEKFLRIFRMSPDTMTISTLGNGRYVDVNDEFTRQMGYTHDEAVGKTAQDLGIWADYTERDIMTSLVKTNGEMKAEEFHFCSKDGTVKTGEMSARIIKIKGELCLISMIRDVSGRIESERALRESEEKFNRIFRMSPDTMVISTLGNGRYVDVNDEFTRQMGYTHDEAVGKTAQDLGIWADYNEREYMAGLLKAGGEFKSVEFHFRGKSSTVKTGEMSARIIKIGNEPCLIAMIRDVSDRIETQKALSESEKRFRLLADNAADIITRHDYKGIINYVSPSVARYGYDTEYFIGKAADDYIHPQDIGTMLKYWREVLKSHEPVSATYRFKKKDGSFIWVECRAVAIRDESTGLVTEIHVATRDIDDRKMAEEALRVSEERYRTLFFQAPVGIIFYSVDMRIIECNERMSFILKTSRNDLINLDLENIADHRLLPLFKKALEGEIVNYEGEYRGETGDVPVFVSITAVPLRDADGVIIGAYVLAEDITERWKAQESLNELTVNLEKKVRERTAQLAASNEELEAFAYSVSHDLRAPLRGMDGFSQALIEDYAGKIDAQGMDYLERIRTSSRKMGQLIDDLLRLSRVTRIDMNIETVKLSSMALEIMEDLRAREPGRNIEFVCNGDYTVEGDPDLLRIVLTNLLSNAWKFTSKRTDARIELGMELKDKKSIYYIRDNGAGFDQAFVNRLFGPFQRLHTVSEFEGNGIGLAMVKKIIRRHGGSIRAEGKVGVGAIFYFSMDYLLDQEELTVTS